MTSLCHLIRTSLLSNFEVITVFHTCGLLLDFKDRSKSYIASVHMQGKSTRHDYNHKHIKIVVLASYRVLATTLEKVGKVSFASDS